MCVCVCVWTDGGTVSHLTQEKSPGPGPRDDTGALANWARSWRRYVNHSSRGSRSPAVFPGKDEVLDEDWKSDVGPSKPCVAQLSTALSIQWEYFREGQQELLARRDA